MLTTYIVGCVALIIKLGPDFMCMLATACLKLVSALMLAAVAFILLTQVKFR